MAGTLSLVTGVLNADIASHIGVAYVTFAFFWILVVADSRTSRVGDYRQGT